MLTRSHGLGNDYLVADPGDLPFEVTPARVQLLCDRHIGIGADSGATFHAFSKQLSGQLLSVVRPQLIVQSWRWVKFHDDDPDSTLILMFTPDPSISQSASAKMAINRRCHLPLCLTAWSIGFTIFSR